MRSCVVEIGHHSIGRAPLSSCSPSVDRVATHGLDGEEKVSDKCSDVKDRLVSPMSSLRSDLERLVGELKAYFDASLCTVDVLLTSSCALVEMVSSNVSLAVLMILVDSAALSSCVTPSFLTLDKSFVERRK